jgi:4-hydroxy-4-methyl-2-oxoglutarate aldolase
MTSNAETAAALRELGSEKLGESGARAMPARLKPVWAGAVLAAPAYPVRCTTGDNLAIHVAVARAPQGAALVVDVGTERELGYWGEVLTTGAQARGIAGLVIDGCVRDSDALEAHAFPVFSTGIALPGATKTLPGSVDRPTVVADVEVDPGDWVVGDRDGVVIVPGGSLAEVVAAGQARAAREAKYFEQLRAGSTTVDLLSLDASPIDGA